MEKCLVQLRLTGSNSFYANQEWATAIKGAYTCSHCRNIYPHVQSIDAIVCNRRRNTDVDLVSPMCGFVRVLSTRLIDIVGLKQIERVMGLGRIFDSRGFEHSGHRTVVAKKDTMIIRGSEPSTAGICRECGRLLFGAAGEQYVIRDQIPPEPFFMSDGQIFCSDRFWKKHIYGAHLTRVEAIEYPIHDKAEDGLPHSIKALQKVLRAQKIFK